MTSAARRTTTALLVFKVEVERHYEKPLRINATGRPTGPDSPAVVEAKVEGTFNRFGRCGKPCDLGDALVTTRATTRAKNAGRSPDANHHCLRPVGDPHAEAECDFIAGCGRSQK